MYVACPSSDRPTSVLPAVSILDRPSLFLIVLVRSSSFVFFLRLCTFVVVVRSFSCGHQCKGNTRLARTEVVTYLTGFFASFPLSTEIVSDEVAQKIRFSAVWDQLPLKTESFELSYKLLLTTTKVKFSRSEKALLQLLLSCILLYCIKTLICIRFCLLFLCSFVPLPMNSRNIKWFVITIIVFYSLCQRAFATCAD